MNIIEFFYFEMKLNNESSNIIKKKVLVNHMNLNAFFKNTLDVNINIIT